MELLDQSASRALARSHEEQEALCLALERIADTLPHDIDPQLCAVAAGTINQVMARFARVERDVLEQWPATRQRVEIDLGATMARLARENEADINYADELQEALESFSAGSARFSAEALGYMLRGFFEARRRRMALERELLGVAAQPAPASVPIS